MSTGSFRIVFQPSGRTTTTPAGTSLLDAAASVGLVPRAPCGGKGTCGKCRVRILRGLDPAAAGRPEAIAPDDWSQGWRMACQTRIVADTVVEIPPAALDAAGPQILLATDGTRPFHLAPAIAAHSLEVPQPTREDDASDTVRLRRAAGQPLDWSLDLLRTLSPTLRTNHWKTTLVRRGTTVLDVLPATAEPPLGVAFDLGTTTVVGTLYDLASGTELGVSSALNGQIPLGDDVLARIEKCRGDAEAGAKMQAAAIGSLNTILDTLCEQAGIAPDRIYDLTLAGNTAMQQLVCGIDSRALGEIPFTPAFSESLSVPAAALGLHGHPKAHLFVFPQIGGFVGGDTVAGILAAELDRVTKPTLLIDIGTNGEIVLALPGGKLVATSTAAGPAFEGARISQGMRAAGGAIDSVLLRDEGVALSVIGQSAPVGLCGTALIDGIAELLRRGILDTTGRIASPDEVPDTVPEALRRHVIPEGDNAAFVLAFAPDRTPAVRLTQRDVRELQLASGAIRAGAETLLAREGLTAADLDAVLLAGAFGNYIRKANALRIGLLPQVAEERVRFIGNAASHGARMALLSTVERERSARVAASTIHVDLGADPEFQMAFGMAMMFPE